MSQFSDNFEGFDGYDPNGDVDLHVIPENGFTGKAAKDGFQFTLENACTSAKKIAITNGGLSTSRGYVNTSVSGATEPVVFANDTVTELKKFEAAIDGIITDGIAGNGVVLTDGGKTVKFTSKRGTAKHFLEFVNKTPVLIGQIKVSTNKVAMFDASFETVTVNPFTPARRESLDLAPYYRSDQNQMFIQIDNANVLISSERILYIELPPESTTTFTFYPRAMLSGDAGMKNRKKLANM